MKDKPPIWGLSFLILHKNFIKIEEYAFSLLIFEELYDILE